jgi:hypothetical protein
VHATIRRVVNEAFAEEREALKPLPLAPYQAVLRLERRVSHEGMVCVDLHSVPDTTRRRVLDIQVLADAIRIFEDHTRCQPCAARRARRKTARSYSSENNFEIPGVRHMFAHMNSWDKSPRDSLTIEHHPLRGVTYTLTSGQLIRGNP